MPSFRAFADRYLAEFLGDLKTFVEIESPTTDKAACDRAGRHLAERFRNYAGAEIIWHPQTEFGDHFEAKIGNGPRKILLLGHFDTVWPVGAIASMPCRREGDRFMGPGCFDMKYGDIKALWALRALAERGLGKDKTFTFFGNADEEPGSPTSSMIIEHLGRESECVFVLEPSLGPEGGVKLWRKGLGVYHLEVRGVASHAGSAPEKGRSAVLELAHQIIDLHGLADQDKGTTVNVGAVRGGIRSNVVAASAEAEIDLRVRTREEIPLVERKIFNRPTFVDGTSVRVWGGIKALPMEETEASHKLYELAKRFAADEGFDLSAGGTGGGSDGQLTAALGIPTLDGLGAIGDGAHADHEYVSVSPIAPRLAWFARLLAEV